MNTFPGIEFGVLHPTASSEYNPDYGARCCALNFQTRENACIWAPASNDLNQYLQFSAAVPHYFHEIHMRGSLEDSAWVESFSIQYSLGGVSWENYNFDQILQGNTNRTDLEFIKLLPFLARFVRILPKTFKKRMCLKLEIFISSSNNVNICYRRECLIPAIEMGFYVTVSSIYSPSYDTSRIRINFKMQRLGGNSWIAAKNDINQWVQISSGIDKEWVKFCIQGDDQGNWVKEFYVSYALNNSWHMYDNGKFFKANQDQSSIVEVPLARPIRTNAIRIHPVKWENYISLRLEAFCRDL